MRNGNLEIFAAGASRNVLGPRSHSVRRFVAASLGLAILCAGSVREARAFDPASAAVMVYQGYKGVDQILRSAGVSHEKIRALIRGGGRFNHVWWGCEYQDGTTAWNNFRDYRTAADVMEYFTGQNNGDCDSRLNSGNGPQVCYGPAGAASMVRAHGQIVRVYAYGPAD